MTESVQEDKLPTGHCPMPAKLICPACGSEMNHHAEKLISAFPGEPGYNSTLAGALEESYCLPQLRCSRLPPRGLLTPDSCVRLK